MSADQQANAIIRELYEAGVEAFPIAARRDSWPRAAVAHIDRSCSFEFESRNERPRKLALSATMPQTLGANQNKHPTSPGDGRATAREVIQ